MGQPSIYASKEVVWYSHNPEFYGDKNTDRFDVFDINGNALGYALYVAGGGKKTGWYAHVNDGIFGPFADRASAINDAMVPNPKRPNANKVIEDIVSITSTQIIFKREIVLVQPWPVKGLRLSLHRAERPITELSTWTSVAAGVVQTNPSGEQHAVVCSEMMGGGPFSPVDVADEIGLLPEARTVLSLNDFNTFLSCYTSSMNNLDNIRALAVLTERLAPEMRFMPPHMIPVMQHGEKFIGRIFLRTDLTGFEALVRLGAEEHQQPKKAIFDALALETDEYQHCNAGWYAMRNLERAVELKIRAPADFPVQVHALSKEAVTA